MRTVGRKTIITEANGDTDGLRIVKISGGGIKIQTIEHMNSEGITTECAFIHKHELAKVIGTLEKFL